ncbi:hypothetical protein CALCODRAFT_126013 [Calocera cornea HHB12733]|uniref:F-box domain-containing protein n=1 Tax=Calocera cornea HHB12733 TaxID=1353952 RepID=A0A165CWS4_9BASI|nr:hypothetical protein CALCODRAFT_126013 [Calocera cornea HHB12733]
MSVSSTGPPNRGDLECEIYSARQAALVIPAWEHGLPKPEQPNLTRRCCSSAQLLPVELLHHIFSLLSGDRSLILDREILRSPQIAVSHVCRSWRSAALGLSSMWSNISVVVNDIQDQSPTTIGALRMAEALLARCKPPMIDMSWQDHDCGLSKLPHQTDFEYRIRHLHFKLCAKAISDIPVYRRWIQSNALETLSLRLITTCLCHRTAPAEEHEAPVPVEPTLPTTSQLKSRWMDDVFVSRLPIGLSRVEDMRRSATRSYPEEHTSISSIFNLLRCMPSLVRLRLKHTDYLPDDEVDPVGIRPPLLELPVLESLTICHPRYALYWLPLMAMPNLDHLAVQIPSSKALRRRLAHMPQLPRIQRLRKLARVTLHGHWSPTLSPLFLEAAPNLEHVILDDTTWTALCVHTVPPPKDHGIRPLHLSVSELTLSCELTTIRRFANWEHRFAAHWASQVFPRLRKLNLRDLLPGERMLC